MYRLHERHSQLCSDPRPVHICSKHLYMQHSGYLVQQLLVTVLYSGTGRGDMHASVVWIAMLQHAITCMQWSRARREQMAELLVGCDSILIQICL